MQTTHRIQTVSVISQGTTGETTTNKQQGSSQLCHSPQIRSTREA